MVRGHRGFLWLCRRVFRAMVERAGAFAMRLGLRKLAAARRLAYAWSPDRYQRFESVSRLILGYGGGSVLDVGGNRGNLSDFLPNTRSYLVADLDRKAVVFARRWRGVRGAVADGSRLPFADRSFDWVVAVEVLEHVPPEARESFAAELTRVARRGAIVHCPCQSSGGLWAGRACDEQFDRWHQSHWGFRDPNVAEHLTCGLPGIEELRRLFPGALIMPSEMAGQWLHLMRRVYGRLSGFLPWGLFVAAGAGFDTDGRDVTCRDSARSALCLWLRDTTDSTGGGAHQERGAGARCEG